MNESQILDMIERRLASMLKQSVAQPIDQSEVALTEANLGHLLLDIETERRRLADRERLAEREANLAFHLGEAGRYGDEPAARG